VDIWYKDFKADLYITQVDHWTLNNTVSLSEKGIINWVPWIYQDWLPCQQDVARLKHAIKAVPTSYWLKNGLEKLGLNNLSDVIYPGVDHTIFRPMIGERDEEGNIITKERLKRSLGLPEDCFLISAFQMNQLFRKPLDLQLEGIKMFRESNTDIDIRFWLHSAPRNPDGWYLPELALEYGMNYQKGDIIFPDQYIMLKGLKGYSDSHIAKLMNASDVVLNATAGESPGMPILESQSCSTPCITTNFSAMPEVNANPELNVKVLRYFNAPTVPWLKKALPDPEDIARKLEIVLNSDPEYYRKRCVDFASKFTWENTLSGWLKVLDDVKTIIQDRCLTIPDKVSPKLQELAKEITEFC
jgi:glycosyltransferase involved in cell wall biosynthesis